MGFNNSLKDRFEKLQQGLSVTVESNSLVQTEKKNESIELKDSSYPEIQNSLRDYKGTSFDWKSTLKHQCQRPDLAYQKDPQIFQLEWSLQNLATQNVIVSTIQTASLLLALPALLAHIEKQSSFWKKMVTGAELIHIEANNQKVSLCCLFGQKRTQLKQILDDEFLKQGIKSYSLNYKDEWTEISLDITQLNSTNVGVLNL